MVRSRASSATVCFVVVGGGGGVVVVLGYGSTTSVPNQHYESFEV